MRTLASKLTLAFLAVALAGTALVALAVGLRTRSEFDRFVLDRYQTGAVEALADYYARYGSWDGLAEARPRAIYHGRGGREAGGPPFVLVDGSDAIIAGPPPFNRGQVIDADARRAAVPIEVDGRVVGRVLFSRPAGRLDAVAEAAFLSRVNEAIVLSALAAIVGALSLGWVLARHISEPVHALSAATKQVARGALGVQVPVSSDDELGELTASFNRMSSDLAEASRLRRQMTADIAHDLRTPVTVILGYTEGLAEGKFASEPAIFEKLHGEARHLTVLIEDLRTLSLADAGELTLARLSTAPAALLERAMATYRPLAEERGITLTLSAAPSLPNVSVDPERMAQVLGNLITNALRHTPPGGSVTLGASTGTSSEASASPVVLSIADTGEGIAPADLPYVFTRHFRADPSRAQSDGASGLGLAIAKSLVEAHGGTIAIDSRVGEGTVVKITLPEAS